MLIELPITLANNVKMSIVGIVKFQTSSSATDATEQITVLILGRADAAMTLLIVVPDEGVRIAQSNPIGRRKPILEVHGTRMAVTFTFRTRGAAVIASGGGDAALPLPQTNHLDRDRETGNRLVKVTHRTVRPVEDALLQGTVGLEKGRGHHAEMPTVRGTNDVIIEAIALGPLVSRALCPPAVVRRRIKRGGGPTRAVGRPLAVDGGHHLLLPQALAVDQGHVVVAEGRPQEESTNVAAVTRP